MKVLHLDFETRSDIDLKARGLHIYARGPRTDIMCAAYAFDDEPVFLWTPGQPLHPRVYDHIERGGEVHAHNATFEQELCNNVGTRLYGWPYLYTEQLVCTMAMSYAMGLPGHLGSTAAALGIAEQKDMAGSRLMLQYCKPKDIENGKIIWWDNPDDLQKLYNYCRQDVVVEREIGKRMMMLSSYERSVWQLDQKINARGIAIDEAAVRAASIIIEEEKERLNEEMRSTSRNQIATCTAVQQIKDYLYLRGVRVEDSLAKPDVVEFLSDGSLPEDCRKILELRQEAGKASAAKVEAMLTRAGPSPDGPRIRNGYCYSGANTRRWAGRGLQLQNLKRPKISRELIDEVIGKLGQSPGISAQGIDALYGPPLTILSDCVRGFLVPATGYNFLCCDFSSIEARVLAWLAGETKVLEIFKTDGKVYEHAAASIFGIRVDQVNEAQRQVGKVAVLALGYGGGVGAFQTMAEGYGVNIAAAYESLLAVADAEQRENAERSFRDNGKRYDGISEQEFVASEITKQLWRDSNPNIVRYWYDLENAAIKAVLNPREKTSVRNVAFKTNGSFLWCQLPSGGVLSFPYPKVEKVKTPWGAEKDALTYMSEDGQSHKWMRFKTYGGSLAENVTQAVARDILADAMLRLESLGYPIVAHVHDEIVCELEKGDGSVEEMARVMCQNPEWAKDLPITASGWSGDRYRK